MIPYAPLTARQAAYIRRCETSWLNVAEGGKRAGKNVINLIAWARCLEGHPDRLHLAAGVSASAAKINLFDGDGFGLSRIFHGRCRQGRHQGRDALFLSTKTGEKIVLAAGGRDAGSARLIKGHSYGSAYVTEVNECHPLFVKEALDRTLASKARRVFFDLNPKPPAHWFYQEFLDYQEQLAKDGRNPGYNYGHFTIQDNLSIADEQLSALLSTYDKGSIWYQSDILGRRTSAAGQIYTGYRYEDAMIPKQDALNMPYQELSVGVDVGSTDATVATLVGILPGYKGAVLADGIYHRQGRESRMEHTGYAEMVAAWLLPHARQFPGLVTVYADSADKFFRTTLRRRLDETGMARVALRAADKSDGIRARIDLTCALLAQGRLQIAAHLLKWHEAFQMATWREDAYASGDWVRVDDGSYPLDCLDSMEYALEPYGRVLIR